MVNVTDWAASKADAEQDDSLQGRGTATAPAAIATIASVTAVKGGIYEITAIAGYGGTADVIDNMDLSVNAVSKLVLPVIAAANGIRVPVTCRIRVAAGQVIAIRSIAIGAGGSVYSAVLVAKRVSG